MILVAFSTFSCKNDGYQEIWLLPTLRLEETWLARDTQNWQHHSDQGNKKIDWSFDNFEPTKPVPQL